MIERFLSAVVGWASNQMDVLAIALVGSHARGTATASSDVDLVMLVAHPERYLDDTAWVKTFGDVEREHIEDWSRVTSLRVYYTDGREVEFGITDSAWAAEPLDQGTKQVASDGFKVLFDRGGYLKLLTME
jgi:predicted nucleotidyltransferase